MSRSVSQHIPTLFYPRRTKIGPNCKPVSIMPRNYEPEFDCILGEDTGLSSAADLETFGICLFFFYAEEVYLVP